MNPAEIKILVVDDDAAVARGTAHLLAKAGYATLTAANGEEAWQALPSFRPHLVLTDREMPVMDGMELCRRIKADAALTEVFVVLISGSFTHSEEQAAGLDVGADGYIARPIANRELLARIHAYGRILQLNLSMRKSEAQFRALTEAAHNAIIMMDDQGAVTFWNTAATRMFGYDAGEMLGRDLHKMIVPERFRPAHHAAFPRWQQTGEGAALGQTLELFAVHRTGTEFPIELSLSALQSDGQRSAVGIIRDITARKHAEMQHAALLHISEAAHATADLPALFCRIHEIVGTLLPARNFYVALHDPGTDLLSFPYFVDELDPVPAPRPPGNGLTGLVLRTGQPLLLTAAMIEALRQEGQISLIGTPPLEWLGVPLVSKERTIGVLAVQIYSGTAHLAKPDLELLTFVSRQIASAIERKRADSRLEAERERLKTILETAGDPIFVKDNEHRIITANSAFCDLFALDLAAVIGRTLAENVAPDERQHFLAVDRQVLDTGITDIREETLTVGGLTRTIVTRKARFIEASGEKFLVGSIHDITQRKQAETQIGQLSAAVEQSPVTIVITDLAGNIEYTNPHFSVATGYTAAEAKGNNPRVLKSGEFPSEEYLKLWQTITTGGTWHGEFHNKRKDGTLFWEDANISVIRNATGQPTHFLAVKIDITERKRIELELKAAKATAEAAAQAKSEFLANMSHEIRTPMNGVIGMTGLLLDTRLNREQREFAEAVRNSADNLMTVINDILDFSKIEAGKLTFEMLDFDLVETLESTLDMLAERAQGKGLELIDSIAPEVPTRLRGDPGRLRQVITNLLGNALKFTEHGEVVVRVLLESETPTHAVVRFNVVDTGIGIPPEVQARLFQSFSQADSSTTRKYGGTGLGLAISKQLVALMHGQIGVQSAAGAGSTFWFTAQFEKQTGAPKPDRKLASSLVNLRVLVVDDNATNRQILRHQIVAWKMQKGSAAGGHEALKILRTAAAAGAPYDLALLDMQMPEMDGMTLARAIKADPAIARTRLVMLTSLGHRFSAEELSAVGLDAYLVKPVKQSRLFDCLADVMGSHLPAETTDPTPPLAPPAPPLPPLHVLVAEDNQVNQKIAMAQLQKLGCTVDVVANGLEVLEALPRGKYDLVFMDCQMPEMDGYEATRAIRQREGDRTQPGRWTAPVPIIAMTANAMQGDREKCLAAGMSDYISKPIRQDDMRAAIERARRPQP